MRAPVSALTLGPDSHRMRLLHVFPSFEIGGSQMRTAQLIRGLGADFEHQILSLDGATGARALLGKDSAVEFIEPPPRRGSLATTRALAQKLRALRPDLLLTYNWGSIDAILASRLAGRIQVCHHEDGFGPDEAAGPLRRRSLARRLILRAVKKVIVPSERLAQIARREWRVPDGKLELIPNGIDLERFRPGDDDGGLRARLGLPLRALLIGAVGSLRPEKNLQRLIDAFAELPAALDAQLVLIGDGAERAALEAHAEASGRADAIHFTGGLADTAPAHRALDLFVLSSDTEQMPLSLVEAMASERPVVATRAGDVERIVPAAQRPHLVELGSPEPTRAELTERMAALLGDLDLRCELGTANRERVTELYAEQHMFERYATLYRGAAGGTPNPGPG